MWMNKFFNQLNKPNQDKEVSANEVAPELKQPVKSPEGSSEISDVVESPDVPDISGRTLSSDLERVRQLQAEQGEITLENFETLTGMKAVEFIQYATGGEQITAADLKDINETLKESLAHLAENSEGSDNSWSERIKSGLRSKTGRMVFMSLLLFLKFAPQAQAAPSELKVIDPEDSKKIEMSSKSIDKSNVYEVPSDSFDGDPSLSEKIENLAKLDLTNSYETDKADIAEADQANIQSQVENFLAKINPNNFNDLMDNVWEIAGSSDERPTNNWEGQNYKLTIARIAAAEEIIKNTIDNHDFTSSGLSAEQVKAIQDKDFNYNIPVSSNGPEQGVTYITDLENPATPGEKFSSDQAKKLKETNPAEYQKLLD